MKGGTGTATSLFPLTKKEAEDAKQRRIDIWVQKKIRAERNSKTGPDLSSCSAKVKLVKK